MAALPHRTLLEKIVRESSRTIEETCLAFDKKARELDEQASLSPRQLSRWMAGSVGNPRPVMLRVAEAFWGYEFELLLGPPNLPNNTARLDVAANDRAVAFDDVYRRSLLHWGAATVAARFATTTGVDLDRDGVITHEDVEQLGRVVARQRRLDARHGAVDLWENAASRAMRIARLLDRAQYSDEVGELLVQVAGQAYICAG